MREIKIIEENLNRRLQELNENNFRLFLNNLRQEQGKNKGKPYTKKTKDNYINKLKKIKKDIFSISNPSDILEIIYAIKNQEIEYDGTYSTTSALKHYLNFLKANLVIKKLHRNNMNIKNIILYGSLGVGKTHNTNKLIKLIEKGKSDKEIFESIKANENSESVNIDDIKDRVKFVTFHQSFGYEDFIEGFRPNIEGNIVLSDGIFKTICQEANEDKEKNYYLVIDEINRGNISKIFGELITLLEEDYQIGHSYFMGIKDDNDLDFILKYKVEPLLEEYFYGDKDGLEKVLKIAEEKEKIE